MLFGESEIQRKYARYIAAGCAAGRTSTACERNILVNNQVLFPAVVIALRVLPVVIGMFLGAPLIDRELESGTFRFSWTQAAERKRQILDA